MRRGRPPSVDTIAQSVSARATSRPSAGRTSEVFRTDVTAVQLSIHVVTISGSPS